jgi:uncharacterized peroxidase-related enzyme
LRRDYRQANLPEQDRAMLDFAVLITNNPTSATPADLDRLRRAGFDDRGILQIGMIAAWFNYINRIADVLGVGR